MKSSTIPNYPLIAVVTLDTLEKYETVVILVPVVTELKIMNKKNIKKHCTIFVLKFS